MQLSNQIILRPRFKIDVNINNEKLLDCFEDSKNKQSEFIVNRLDEHVFIKLTKIQRHFWSPQLHLEINETTKKKSTINGLFGPNPEVWTMFMFLHFVTASLFIGFGIWTYTNLTLNNSYAIQLFLTLFMIVIWIILYAVGRMGREKGKPDMHHLNSFIKKIIVGCNQIS